jgi:hypothetical protein
MKRSLILTSVVLIMYSCHSGQTDAVKTDIKQTDTAKKNYLPAADYLKAEIAAVDSFPLRLMRYRIINGKTDSGIITTPVFDQIAKEFLMPDLDSSRFEKRFDENSFVDRSTDLVSFTYSTKDTGYGLKRVDILLSPGAAGVDRLHSIYMEAISGNQDTSIISKMSWKAGRNLSVLHIRQPRSGKETMEQTIVVWDPRE